MPTKTATLERYHVYGTSRHHLRLTYKGKTLRWHESGAEVWSDWLDQSQTADIENARTVAKRFGFTHLRFVGDWDKRTKPENGRIDRIKANPSIGQYGTRIVNAEGTIIRVSRNLRGLLEYARVSRVSEIETQKDPQNPTRGLLLVRYFDRSHGFASFASHPIMIDWVRNRRSWSGARINHKDGDMGYLTKPGIIAGN